MIGQQLYQLTPRDQQVTRLDMVFEDIRTATASASLTADFVVPNNRVLVLKHCDTNLLAGAAQFVINTSIYAFTGAKTVYITKFANASTLPTGFGYDDRNIANITNSMFMNWDGELYIPPGYTLRASGLFNAGVAVNQIQFNVVGLLIPRGNFAV